MYRHAAIAMCLLPILAACGGDDPDNVPQYGQWQMVRTLDSVTIDGIAFTPDELPAEFREMEGTETVCGEPVYIDREWQARDVAQRTNGLCELEQYSHDATSASLEGQCQISAPGAEYAPRMRGSSSFDAAATRDVVTMEGTLTAAGDNAPHVLKVIAVQEGTRIGEC